MKELLTAAVTVTCVKRYRYNHFAPAVVKKHNQSDTQFDWWITDLRINDIPIREWCEAVGIYYDQFSILEQPFKSMAQAKRTMVEHYADRLEWYSPSPDGYDSDEYLERWETIMASLKGTE